MENKIEKKFISANRLYLDSLKLAKKINDAGFVPDVLIALWRGGTPVGIVVHEYFRYLGKDIKFHKALRTESYRNIDSAKEVKVEAFQDLLEQLNDNDNLLIVDDIFDTGKTISALFERFNKLDKKLNVKIATVYYKPKRNLTNIKPDFYLKKTDAWVVFPHELEGLTKEEIKEKNQKEYELLFD